MARQRKQAFTLVELLVVIGIIALLVSMLLPALNRARKAALSIQCITNLRAIMQAVAFYANDNRGAMVPAQWLPNSMPSPQTVGYPVYNNGQSPTTAYPSDAYFLGKYTDRVEVEFVSPTAQFQGYARKKSVWYCPENTYNPNNSPDTHYEVSYGLNMYAFPVIQIDSWVVPAPLHPTGWETGDEYPSVVGHGYLENWCWKINQIRSPSRMMGFVDSSGARFYPADTTATQYNFFGNLNGYGGNWSFGQPGSNYNHAIRHPNNSTNVGFMDGHVASVVNRPFTYAGQTGLSLHAAWAAGEFVVDRKDQ